MNSSNINSKAFFVCGGGLTLKAFKKTLYIYGGKVFCQHPVALRDPVSRSLPRCQMIISPAQDEPKHATGSVTQCLFTVFLPPHSEHDKAGLLRLRQQGGQSERSLLGDP